MKLKKPIRDLSKKVLVSALAAYTLALSSCATIPNNYAADKSLNPMSLEVLVEKDSKKKEMPPRQLVLDFSNPINSPEANSKALYSANEIIGKGSDLLGNYLDDKVIARIGLLASHFYISNYLRHTSHELSHTGQSVNHGTASFGVDTTPRGLNFSISRRGIPINSRDYHLIHISALNQEELNAYTIAINTNNNLTFDNGILFISSKFLDVVYNLAPTSFIKENTGGKIGDINQHIEYLKKQGTNLSKTSLLLQSLMADLGSLRTIDSLIAVGNYLTTGERSIKPTIFNIDGTQFTAPLINHYLVPISSEKGGKDGGGFYNITSTINPYGANPLEVAVGVDTDFIGGGRVNHLRLGAQLHKLKLWDGMYSPEISPFFALNLQRSPLDYRGVVVGTEVIIPIPIEGIGKGLELTGRAQYNKGDLIEEVVKGKDRGFNGTLGIRMAY